MKILKHIILAMAISAAFPQAMEAQEYISTPVTVSKEKVRVNGKVCYSHIVKDKQTLFSIAKAYDVSVDEILALNPSLKESGLKKNSIILIPSKEAHAHAPVPEPESASAPEHEPAPAATLEAVPESVRDTETEIIKEKEPAKKAKTHTVKWFEDLDVIAEKYGVSVEAIMKANGLTGRKLAKRQKLIIPEPGEFAEEVAQEEAPGHMEAETAIREQIDTIKNYIEDALSDLFFTPKEEVKATLILPMKASTDNVSRNNMDFYSGVLLAVRDLAETGISTELNVYDSSDSSHPIACEDIEGSDLIIGPVSYKDLKMLLESECEPQMVISPLDPKAESLALYNHNLIQVPTPQEVQCNDLLNWIKEDTMPGDTLLIISEKGARESETATLIAQEAEASGLPFIPFSYSILEGRDITEPLTNLMTASGANRVLIASESEAFVNDVVRNLNILAYNKLNVILYAPARIRNFETIEVENLHNVNLHASLGYLIDYDSQQVKNFLLKYRALYNTEPTQYAYQGYDIASYFIGMCGEYGSRWTKKLDGTERHMLQSTYRFIPEMEGGYVNNGVRRVVYGPGWTVTKTK